MEKGHLFEQWVVLQCLWLIRSRRKSWNLASYRTDAGAEVDLVIDRGTRLAAVECKYGQTVSEADLRGLRSFESVAPKPVDKRLVYRGQTAQKFPDGTLALPYQQFLKEIEQED